MSSAFGTLVAGAFCFFIVATILFDHFNTEDHLQLELLAPVPLLSDHSVLVTPAEKMEVMHIGQYQGRVTVQIRLENGRIGWIEATENVRLYYGH